MIDLKKFETTFKKDLSEVLNFLWDNDLYITLVGGAVRDYIIHEKLAHDLDFEIRSTKSINENEWQHKLNDVFKAWPFGAKVETLPFSIFRLSYHGYDLEFSSPRREFFHQDRLDHKNFEAKLLPELSYIDSFSRRDFTVNALGIELKKEGIGFIDPFHGEGDLKAKLLRPISHDFPLDPVRFLRAIRFHFQLHFEFSQELIDELKIMDLCFLSAHYVKTEMLKTANSGAFWNKFRSLCLEWKIPVSPELMILFELETHGETILTLKEWVISCHLNKPLTLKQFQTIISYFQLSEVKLKSILSFYDQALLLKRDELLTLQKKSWQDALHDPMLAFLLELKENFLKVKARDLTFGFSKEQSQLFLELKLDQSLGTIDLKAFLKENNIPVTYSSSLKLIFHLKSLAL